MCIRDRYIDRIHLLERFRVQHYIAWTSGPYPLQFTVDAVEGVRQLNVMFNNSHSVIPAYKNSYGVVLLDNYLQPSVPCMRTLTNLLV